MKKKNGFLKKEIKALDKIKSNENNSYKGIYDNFFDINPDAIAIRRGYATTTINATPIHVPIPDGMLITFNDEQREE